MLSEKRQKQIPYDIHMRNLKTNKEQQKGVQKYRGQTGGFQRQRVEGG